MDNLINILKDTQHFKVFREDYCKKREVELEEVSTEEVLLAYAPNLAKLNHEEQIELLINPELPVKDLYNIFNINLTKEETSKILNHSDKLWTNILEDHPEYFTREMVAKYASSSFALEFSPFVKDYDEIFEGLLLRLTNYKDPFAKTSIINMSFTNEQLKRLFTTVDFDGDVVKKEYLSNEELVITMLESGFKLPVNCDLIPTPIIERNIDLFIKAIAENRVEYYNIRNIIFKSATIFEKYLCSDVADSSLLEYTDQIFLPIMERNVDKSIKSFSHNKLMKLAKNSEIFLKKTWQDKGLNSFSTKLVADNLDYLIENGLNIENLPNHSKKIFESDIIVRKILEHTIKNSNSMKIIELASKEGLSNNIEFACNNGYELSNTSPKQFFENDKVVQYLINNNKTDLYYLISPELINKYEDKIKEKISFKEGMDYGNLVTNPAIVLKIINQSSKYDIINRFDNIDNHFNISKKWFSFIDEIYNKGFRLSDNNHPRLLIDYPEIMQEYLKNSKNPNDLLYANSYGYKYDKLVDYAADLGFILQKPNHNETICTNDKIIRNTLKMGKLETFNYVGRKLTNLEIELAYKRGYRLTEKSSQIMKSTLGIFKKEIELNNAKCLNYIETNPNDDMIIEYYNQDNIITSESSDYLRQNPLTIHLALKRTNDPFIIDLATGDIDEEDFVKALKLGYIVTNKTPLQILNNEKLMEKYIESELEKHPENKQKINSISKIMGSTATSLALKDLLSNQEFLDTFTDIEITKIFKYVYLVETKDQLLDIVKNNNSKLLKDIYTVLLIMNPSEDFNTIMFKKIVANFSNYTKLCEDFVKKDYSSEDVKLLHKVLVNGEKALIYNESNNQEQLNNETVSNIEELRNYKKTTYQSYKSSIDYGENSGDKELLKDIIFQLLCNKTYNQITILLNELFNTERINELLECIENQEIKDELENYKVFIELIERIYNMNDFEEVVSLAKSLNEKVLEDSPDINKIWLNFNNIEEEAKKFYGEEILESVTTFKNEDLEKNKDVQFITGDTARNDEAPIIVHKDKYNREGFEYKKETYSGKVDLIELNGTPFVSFVHVLNAYGSGATLADFKKPRLIGRTYLCTSAIDEEYVGCVRREVEDMDHVALLFNDFDSEQLALASNKDIASIGKNNDLELNSRRGANLHPVRKTIKNTKSEGYKYNEYVFYREDNQGNQIKPSAVFVQGKEPVEAEIQAAIYLGVPLVKINKDKYNDTEKEIKENRKKINPKNKKRTIAEWKKLRKNIEEIKKLVESKEENETHKKAM
ncbi:MAG: hypothetical protein VZS44_05915 [Bacilli bacterium]|nr:hypothetical protein [Bacilli bacterium]